MADTAVDQNNSTTLSPIELAAELTAAWLANPNTRASAEDVPAFLRTIHGAISELGNTAQPAAVPEQEFSPAVSARKSLSSRDHIISMIDGKPYKALRRHLSTNGLTPEDYRARYNLPKDYPMVAPAYAEQRRELAKKIGLGRKPGQKKTAAKPVGRPRVVKSTSGPLN